MAQVMQTVTGIYMTTYTLAVSHLTGLGCIYRLPTCDLGYMSSKSISLTNYSCSWYPIEYLGDQSIFKYTSTVCPCTCVLCQGDACGYSLP